MGLSPIGAARVRHCLAEVAARTGIDCFRTSGSVTVRCPLPSHGHPDRTPSMRLHLDDGIFFCFGCGAKGDVVEWVCHTEGVNWREAIGILDVGRPLSNAWAGQALSAGEGSQHARTGATAGPGSVGQAEAPNLNRTPPERVHAALDAAWGYYTYPPLRYRGEDYLRERGIDVRVLEAYTGRPEVGHTPAKADGLVTSLRSKGFSDDELVDSGLAHRRLGNGPISDFYRQRVLIPVRDYQGRIAGIIGRNLGDQQRWAKYKNPPRTAVYDKSVNLYQTLPAPADPQGRVIVVEGTLDAMAIAIAAIRTGQADRFCPVTQSGRELSDTQVRRIITLHPSKPVLGFDGDTAGRDSAVRYEQAFGVLGRQVIVSTLPAVHDPASWLAVHGDAGLDAWRCDDAVGAGRGLSVRPPGLVPGGVRNAKSARVQSPRSGRARYSPAAALAAASGPDDGLVAL